jgi:benzoate/toluate 1,2-dioxygenase subunit beta
MDEPFLAEAERLVAREGWLLDCKNWDEWLSLYTEDATYWLPCFKDESNLTKDPERELSLIYYSGRAGLEDRVYRIRTGQSLASTPLPRTCHMVTIAECVAESDGGVRVESNWVTYSYKLEKAVSLFGTQTHRLRKEKGGLRIAWREIILMNDIIPSVLDIYSV